MSLSLHGRHLIAGDWVDGEDHFQNMPVEGEALSFSVGTASHVDQACQAAAAAFLAYSETSREARAAFLRKIAEEIDARGDAITEIGSAETGLPAARLQGERGRTVGQLRLFADHIEAGDYLDRRFDEALPERAPLPRPELHMIQVAIGPVAVFGASNFPLAFSVAGGDTASALAAGCPVVVKGHPAHPGTSEVVAEAIKAAVEACDMPAGVFSLVHGNTIESGGALVQHPAICAVGFTGSLGGGRALFDLCAQRETPIPFFGELGSVNPMFLLPEALAARGTEIGNGWAASLTMGVGQFCTNPGIAVIPKGAAGDALVEAARAALGELGPQTMLTDGIAGAYRAGNDKIKSVASVRDVLATTCEGRAATPNLYEVDAADWLADPILAHEVFGPLGIAVRVEDDAQMLEIAKGLQGQLTATLHMDAGDTEAAKPLVTVLKHKAGRLLANGFPTGVEVSDTMVHGGPYPATTNFGATSVGTLSIRRWLRPVCFQNLSKDLLPADLG